MKYTQQTVEAFRGALEDAERRTAEQETWLDDLSGREREYLYWRLRWRRREMKVMRRRLASLEESIFARDVLGGLKQL